MADDGDSDGGGTDDVSTAAAAFPRALLLWFGLDASNPVHCIMDPSLRERMRVDCTPGRDVRWESKAVTCCGICGCYMEAVSVRMFPSQQPQQVGGLPTKVACAILDSRVASWKRAADAGKLRVNGGSVEDFAETFPKVEFKASLPLFLFLSVQSRWAPRI